MTKLIVIPEKIPDFRSNAAMHDILFLASIVFVLFGFVFLKENRENFELLSHFNQILIRLILGNLERA